MGCMVRISHPGLALVVLSVINALVCFKLGWSMWSILRWLCRSRDFAFDVLMMPHDRDVLMPYENAFLKFNSRQKFKNTRYNIKKISSVFRKGIPN